MRRARVPNRSKTASGMPSTLPSVTSRSILTSDMPTPPAGLRAARRVGVDELTGMTTNVTLQRDEKCAHRPRVAAAAWLITDGLASPGGLVHYRLPALALGPVPIVAPL
jgi:hypothetical protein